MFSRRERTQHMALSRHRRTTGARGHGAGEIVRCSRQANNALREARRSIRGSPVFATMQAEGALCAGKAGDFQVVGCSPMANIGQAEVAPCAGVRQATPGSMMFAYGEQALRRVASRTAACYCARCSPHANKRVEELAHLFLACKKSFAGLLLLRRDFPQLFPFIGQGSHDDVDRGPRG